MNQPVLLMVHATTN